MYPCPLTLSCRSGAKHGNFKSEEVGEGQVLAKELETSTTAIIGTFSKFTVAKDYQLRKVIREAGGKYRVVKNKLAAISG